RRRRRNSFHGNSSGRKTVRGARGRLRACDEDSSPKDLRGTFQTVGVGRGRTGSRRAPCGERRDGRRGCEKSLQEDRARILGNDGSGTVAGTGRKTTSVHSAPFPCKLSIA